VEEIDDMEGIDDIEELEDIEVMEVIDDIEEFGKKYHYVSFTKAEIKENFFQLSDLKFRVSSLFPVIYEYNSLGKLDHFLG